MKIKRLFAIMCLIIAIFISDYAIWKYEETLETQRINVHFTISSKEKQDMQIFFLQKSYEMEFDESLSFDGKQVQNVTFEPEKNGSEQNIIVQIPVDTYLLRIDPSEGINQEIVLSNVYLEYQDKILENDFSFSNIVKSNSIEGTSEDEEGRINITTGEDTFLVWRLSSDKNIDSIRTFRQVRNNILKVSIIAFVDLLLVLIFWKRKAFFEIPMEVWNNKRLTINLAKNDFKTRFAGSYLGIIWAFVQPIVTVIVYWFVFEKALNAGTQSTKSGIEAPYVLWLIAGLVPWFYFSEALNSGTNTLIDYSYLVKKVVFNISTLPIVKVLSSLFVHLFFVVFMLVMYAFYRFVPTWYMLQLIYYSFAMIFLCVGIVYATSAVMVFFRDLSQIVGIILQVGMWATPIMWNIDAMTSIPKVVLMILKLNPMFYIVSGYRDALLNNVWFWEKPGLTLYFWIVTIIIYMLGTTIFRKLKIHFADVL